ncbi:TonB-dependent receptor domain-containing protein [Chromobacterium haemolyticum]|uniref:TonB-dependent receptor domain-containing protein n=1 Tax=Chromobacterium haemolyticum TaxID=394935 RepID=UPI0015E676AC|nr:TonB-dependent receptor [Chromobacterium haemolyticum]
MFKPQQCALLVSLACAGQAYAANVPEFAGDPVVVTAGRVAQPLSRTLADATVVTREEIEESGAQTLQQVLSRQAAVSIASNGGPGSASSIYIRGNKDSHTVVLVDGVRIYSATLGTTTIQNIPLAQIERIEILRGPASSLYGADAIGGVIQIFTRKGEGEPRWNAGVEFGSRGTGKLSAGVAGKSGSTAYSLQFSHAQSDGFSATNSRNTDYYNPDNDGYRNDSYAASLTQTLSPGHDLTVRLFQTFAEADIDYTNAWKGQDRSKSRLTGQSVESKNRFNDVWTSTLRFARSQDKSEEFHNGDFDRRTSFFQTTQNEWQWQNDLSTKLGVFILGASHLDQKIASDGTYTKNSRTTNAGFVSYQLELGKHLLQASLRNDHDDQFGGKMTGKAGYGYRFADGWLARVGYGTGYKAPSFNDLYYPDSGNPNLKPESSKNTELALQYRKDGRSASLTLFQNKVEQLIQWAQTNPADSNSWRPSNVDRATIRGLSLEAAAQWLSIDWQGNLTLMDARDDKTGSWLANRPRQSASVSAAKQWEKWTLGAEQQVASRRAGDATNSEAKALHGYGVTNFFANYRFAKNWTATARADNLFNREYETAYGYNTGGLGVFLGVRFSQ